MGAIVVVMLVQNIFDRGNYISPVTAKTKKRDNGLGPRWEKPRPLEKRNRFGAKEILARNVIK